MNEKLEQYIKDLSPELQEKARQCKDMNELQEFFADNDIELSEDALEMVAGGGCGDCDHTYSAIEKISFISGTPYSYDGGEVTYAEKCICTKCGSNYRFQAQVKHSGAVTDSPSKGLIITGYESYGMRDISEAVYNAIKASGSYA